MAHKDLREWIDLLEKNEQLVRIKEEVDWQYEIGCIIRRVYDIPGGGPALLFENIKGYKNSHGKRFFGASLASYKRIALAMGLPMDTPYPQLIQEYLRRTKKPIPPVVVKNAPCKEVIEKGKKVNLLEFPVPHLHPMDGGRYMGTFHLVITKDPETGMLNMGMYRMMLHDSCTLGGYLLSFQHWGQHAAKYREKMPIAICFGPTQNLLLTAFAPLEHPPDEFHYSGGLSGKPVRLVPCETHDLMVPADCEIVLEGHLNLEPSTFRQEGPFGEYVGYTCGRASPKPTITINCVTHRKDPIFQGTLEGRSAPGANEDHHGMSVVLAAFVYDLLKRSGIDVTGVNMPASAQGATHAIIGIRQKHQGEALRVASLLWGTKPSIFAFKMVTVVDEDIDVFNPAMVEFAISTRVYAKEDIKIIDGFHGSPIDPSIPVEDRAPWMGAGRWARVLIDATRPFHWPPREEWGGRKFQPVQAWPDNIEKLIDKKWERYGLGQYERPPAWKSTY